MKKLKIITLVMMFAFLTTISGNVIADETIATPNQLIVFKINHSSYYTQEIGSSEVKSVQVDAAPFIKDSRTFVPVRFLGNALGVSDSNITWDNTARKATLKGKSKLELTIGSKTMLKDGQKSVMDVAPLIANPGRTMLPARYVAEGLGFKVDWDAESQLVIAYPEGQTKPDLTVIKTKMGIETPISSVTVQDLGNTSGVQAVKADGYNIKINTNGDINTTAFLGIADENIPGKWLRVVCTSNPEFNTCKWSYPDGTWKDRSQDVWTNDYMLFREGYTTNPKSGMIVTFDIYGGYTGDANATGVKIATIRKTLP